ncbi:MAG TPA: VTT domain-containing protein [Thermomicrobiaceae bacterium]|nr:VTT domain-containing protein [Thermomicrobiaceae bacterium]
MIFVGELGVPTGMPVEIALLLAGSFAVHSVPGLIVSLVIVAVADICGTTTLHLVARTGGSRLLSRILGRFERRSEDVMERWRARFHGHDMEVVLVGRMLPLVRMYIAIGAGLLRIRFRDFLIGAAPAGLIWAGTPLVIGYFFRHDVQRLATDYTVVTQTAIIIGPAVVLIAVLAWWVRRASSTRARLRRGRAAAGLAIAGVAVAYFVDVLTVDVHAIDGGLVGVPAGLIALWLAVLGTVAIALVAVAFVDFRAAYRLWEQHLPFSRVVAAELATTLVWLTLVATIGAIVLALELHYPAL